ncbi:CASP-like protein ARALYDRAFT_485429 isoform X1 [Vigna radiata var. radiata]|uniref:CASP-like protein n=1 Tax=Vigna radiata var. radiata TaxID=3916 RepID=A0A1S3UR46_VIGRR|nr:CASP-like protein ARALYDRAFT_485429 isoform X1 [Vigna radiata var. radiata]
MLRACFGLNYHGRMEELPGAFGSSASLALRLGQTVFSTASLLFMCLDVDFYGYTAFCYLVTVMGLVIPWSITLLVVDAYSVFIKCLPLQRRLVMIVFLGDLILSYLSLAAACSTASVTDLLLDADRSYCPAKLCGRYQLSAAMAFLSWFLSSASCLFNFWLFPSL